jgi:hypothetical protein
METIRQLLKKQDAAITAEKFVDDPREDEGGHYYCEA